MNETQAKERIARLVANAEEKGRKGLAEAGTEAIKAFEAKEKLRREIPKLEQEVSRCREIADKNALYRLDATANVWYARANAIRDCIGVIERILGG